ncbi:hypothetical protein D7X94_13415 [Acutalibacter sp. 1XD8-33]|nr:hypothetical protein D7X94_13415 [Acutalibacter sp. 1XD8-33]
MPAIISLWRAGAFTIQARAAQKEIPRKGQQAVPPPEPQGAVPKGGVHQRHQGDGLGPDHQEKHGA